jgi:hydroxymethylpyrimidine pyrophosphatase-like HAD family hydrolase
VIILFSDIDDTLIHTKQKLDRDREAVVGAYSRDGEEHSFFYKGTKNFIDRVISSGIEFIPTTARNLNSYKRTVFYENSDISTAILNFGGEILVENELDREWQSLIEEKYSKIEPIEEIYESLEIEMRNLNFVIKTIDGFYVSLYNRYHLNDETVLKEAREILQNFTNKNQSFYLYENSNSFAILPNCLNKSFAVEYLIEKHNPLLTIGAGDNISDLDFMKLTSFHLVPNESDIAERLTFSV